MGRVRRRGFRGGQSGGSRRLGGQVEGRCARRDDVGTGRRGDGALVQQGDSACCDRPLGRQ